MQKFVAALKCLGYVLRAKDASNRMFVILELTKSGAASGFSGIKWPPLKACTYKRR